MAEEKVKAVVIFRAFPEGDVVAIFPEIPADNTGQNCMSYMHVGQHGGADCSSLSRWTRPATRTEYAPLKRELESIGYILDVQKRITAEMTRRRIEEVDRQYS